MWAARESGRTYLSRKEMAAKMGRNKTVNLHKYNSRREKKTSTVFIPFFEKVDV
jgi:hypothetical protein